MFCPKCGAKSKEESHFCSECGAALTIPDKQAPETAAPAPVQEPAVSISEPIAALGNRFLALVLDTILITAVFAVIGMLIASRFGGITSSGFSMKGNPALLAMLLTTVFAFLYFWLFEGFFGATIGKMIVGIRVADISGRACDLKQALIRNLLRIIDGLAVYLVGFLVAVFSKRRQRLGDHIANTLVVDKQTGKAGRVILIALWFAIIIGSIVLAWSIHKSTAGDSASSSNVTAISGDLKIVDFSFLEGKEGPPRLAGAYKPGDKLYAKYNIIGYSTDDQGQASLQLTVVVLDPGNQIMFNWKGGLNQKLEANSPANGWCNFNIVPFAMPGDHKIQIKVTDTIKNTVAEFTANFNVEAPPAVLSGQLELRDMIMSDSDGGPSVSPMATGLGNTVYTRAKLAGMQINGNNVNVRIAYQLINSQGSVVLDKPDFLSVNDTFDYHPRSFFLPVSAHVTLPTQGPVGTYVQKFVVNDLNSGRSATHMLNVIVK
jgi:uncharacterized RDD family membrane protein YckC